MYERDRVKLLNKYKTPRFHFGDVVMCELRGYVKIVGLTSARIPWPKCRSGRAHAIILYGDLAKAVRQESVPAICYWFGVGNDTVWKWRQALGVDRMNEGTFALQSRWAPETVQGEKSNKRRARALKSPERGAKIAAALRGKPRPAHVVEAVRRANIGRKASAEARRKMSEAHKRRAAIDRANGIGWTDEQIALLGTMTDREVGIRTGRDTKAVCAQRTRMGIPAFERHKSQKPITWTPAMDRKLGTMTDADLARQFRCTPFAVFYRRQRLKIPRFRP